PAGRGTDHAGRGGGGRGGGGRPGVPAGGRGGDGGGVGAGGDRPEGAGAALAGPGPGTRTRPGSPVRARERRRGGGDERGGEASVGAAGRAWGVRAAGVTWVFSPVRAVFSSSRAASSLAAAYESRI